MQGCEVRHTCSGRCVIGNRTHRVHKIHCEYFVQPATFAVPRTILPGRVAYPSEASRPSKKGRGWPWATKPKQKSSEPDGICISSWRFN
jgi:hypothetical protein